MVIVPVAKAQVGCIGVRLGVVGVAGCAKSVMLEGREIHPAVFCAMTACVELAANPL